MDTDARSLDSMSPQEIRDAVFHRYGCVADEPGSAHGFPVGREFAEAVGYEPTVLDSLPPACSDTFTGAGNPQAAVALQPDEKLLDLGCGAGLDLCLYARRFGQPVRLAGLDGSRSMAAVALGTARSVAVQLARAPPIPPHGVRTAERMTTS